MALAKGMETRGLDRHFSVSSMRRVLASFPGKPVIGNDMLAPMSCYGCLMNCLLTMPVYSRPSPGGR